MWIVFGTKSQLTRVPGGLKVERRCDRCGEVATFYEKHVTKTARLYFVDVFDYEKHRVMACGCCGACYATDELGARRRQAGEDDLIGDRLHRAADTVGGYLERAAGAVEDGLSSLFSEGRPRPPSRPTSEDRSGAHREPDRTEYAPRDDIDTGVGRVDDDLEARFRALEEEDRRSRG